MSLMDGTSCKIRSAFLGTLILLAAIIAYSQYVTLKQRLLLRISDKATLLIGQKTEIGNITFTPAGDITVHDILISNPEGFGQGQLLSMKRLRLDMRYGELVRGKFSFRSIEADSPELFLMTDGNGRLNLSGAFREFLARKGAFPYRIDALEVHKAAFSFNNNPLYTARDISLTLNTLSSDAGTKSSARGSLTYLGHNIAAVQGWAFLRDTPRKFGVSLSSDAVDPSLLGKICRPCGMDLEKIRGTITATAEGDTEKGTRLTASILMKSAGLPFMKKDRQEVSLHAEVFLEPSGDSLLLKRAVFGDRDGSSMQIRGTVRDILRNPSYTAEIKIPRVDLSLFRTLKGVSAGGMLTSDLILLEGRSFSSLPEMTGTVTIGDGTLSMERIQLQRLQARVAFSSGKGLTAHAEASADVLKAGPYVFKSPAALTLSADGKGRPEGILLFSQLSLSDIGMLLSGKNAQLQSMVVSFDGTVRQNAVLGKMSLMARGMDYDQFRVKNLSAGFTLDYEAGRATVKDISVESAMAHAEADAITIILPQATGKTLIDAKNLRASRPEWNAALKGMDCSASFFVGDRDLSGNISFVADNMTLGDISAGAVEGTGSLDGTGFSLDVSSTEIFRGAASVSLKGTSPEGPFPLSVEVHAGRIDLKEVSQAAGRFIPLPYRTSGEVQQLTYSGTMSSPESIIGTASLAGKNISVTGDGNRSVLKDALLHADALFRKTDVVIKAHLTVGSIAAALLGSVSRFAAPDRSLHVSLDVPEVKVSDIRTAFWDIVPDHLLYVGLNGSISLDLNASYGNGTMKAEGAAHLKDVMIEGENGEYSVGPINGMVPLHYDAAGYAGVPLSLPSFERADFEETNAYFRKKDRVSGHEIRIGSVRYGFRLLEDISLWLEQKDRALNITRISAKMFGGTLSGAAAIELSPRLAYRAGVLAEGVSLARLCDEIQPIKGYLSGKIAGAATLKGDGAGLTGLIGKADFWTYGDRQEKTLLSREFLQKIGGPQVRAYLGERRFDKGIMSLYLQNGFLVFRELEISNKNMLGITDLSIKVAPLNNRIAIDHLMWTIAEAAERAKKEEGRNQ